MFQHVFVGVSDFERALAFLNPLMKCLGRSGSVCLNSFSRKISGAIAGWMCSGRHGNRNRFSLRNFLYADGGVSAAQP